MRTTRPEAFDLLHKWASEETLLECSLKFPVFRARFRGRLRSFSADKLKLWSDDTRSELSLVIAPWMEFGFGDASKAEGPDRFEGILAIFFRVGEEGEEPDLITLAEIIEETPGTRGR